MSNETNTETKPMFGVLALPEALAAIRAANARVGLSVSKADEIDMANHLASAFRHDIAANRTFLVDGAGNARSKVQDGAMVDLSLADFISMIQATATPKAPAKPSPAAIPNGANRTERAIATNAALRSDHPDAKAAMAVDLVAKFGNPWRSGNRTHQAFVTNTNPALAKKLHDTAGL